jgi:predicted porin
VSLRESQIQRLGGQGRRGRRLLALAGEPNRFLAAGYGMLGNAIRVTTRPLDVMNGDLVLEATIDQGKTGFTKNKPLLIELYAQYHQGDLVVDAVFQNAKNGKPLAWGHGPFGALTDSAADDSLLTSGAEQSMAMAVARYQLTSQIELSGGVRTNRWSGMRAIQLSTGAQGLWNNMFNVAWDTTVDGVANPGYSATSVDVSAGARYRTGPWTASVGVIYLGTATTSNPTERGQSNDATAATAGLNYDYGQGIQLYSFAGMSRFGRIGLSPMSMPGNNAFWGVDSRVKQKGNWFGAGVVYTF